MNSSLNWVEELRHSRRDHLIGRKILYYERIESTNREAREKALGGEGEGAVILAEAQTQGKGRMGRSWNSPGGMNVYFSVVLRPPISPREAPQITLLAGIAVARGIGKASGLDARIKWPNDVFIHGEKTAGILAEMEGDRSRLRFIILGVGINVNWPKDGIPPELRGIATSLQAEAGREFSRAKIAAEVLNEVEEYYSHFRKEGFSRGLRDEWNRLSWVNGKRGTVRFADEEVSGEVLGLDTDGALLLIDQEGKTRRFIAGDFSLRI